MTTIAIASDQGARMGTVERVRIGSDGGAQEMWVRLQNVVKRVPVTAVSVVGSQCVRTLSFADFEAAPSA
jgi:hypothetical protein